MTQTPSSIEQLLIQDQHIVSITYSSFSALPNVETEIDYGFFPQTEKELVQKSFREIYEYLKKPIIQDNFTSHSERREWIVEMTQKHGLLFREYVHKNKLRGNTLTPLLIVANYLEEAYQGSRKETVARVYTQIQHLSSQIAADKILLSQKIEWLSLFDQLLEGYISLFKK